MKTETRNFFLFKHFGDENSTYRLSLLNFPTLFQVNFAVKKGGKLSEERRLKIK